MAGYNNGSLALELMAEVAGIGCLDRRDGDDDDGNSGRSAKRRRVSEGDWEAVESKRKRLLSEVDLLTVCQLNRWIRTVSEYGIPSNSRKAELQARLRDDILWAPADRLSRLPRQRL